MNVMKKTNSRQEILFSGSLKPAEIDAVSELIAQTMTSARVSEKDALRMRLSVESVMGIWAEKMGEDTVCRLVKKQRFGKTSLILQANGYSVDPTQYQDELLLSVSSNPNIVAALGLPAEYRYYGGRNELLLHLPRKKTNPLLRVFLAMAAALVVGFCVRGLFPAAAPALSSMLLTPLMSTISKALCLIAGPLVFLSVFSGITGVGDVSSFGKIGGTLTRRFLVMTFVLTVLLWLSLVAAFPVTLSGGMEGEGAFRKLLDMILDIVPKDIITPFQTGNALQIIFLAACAGLGGIVLGETVEDTVKVLNQVNAIVQRLMIWISAILPAYIFLSISNLIITSNFSEFSQILVPLLLIVGFCLLIPILYGVYASLKTGFPLGRLFRSQLQTFLVALSTASSAASFGVNVECCEKKLGIDARLTRFGVPFGQVLFKTAAPIIYVILTMYMANFYGIPMTPSWVVSMVIVSAVLSVATPPIPGGQLSAIVVLYAQLGIPASCLALSTTILMFTDYTVTACDLACLQQELLINAKKLGLMNQIKE